MMTWTTHDAYAVIGSLVTMIGGTLVVDVGDIMKRNNTNVCV